MINIKQVSLLGLLVFLLVPTVKVKAADLWSAGGAERGNPGAYDAMRRQSEYGFVQPMQGRKISLQGMPLSLTPNETRSGSDNYQEETYVDVFSRSLGHSITDVHIPVGSDHFSLEVRRTYQPEVWQESSENLSIKPNKPFGICWSSGLIPTIELSCDRHAEGYITVTDHTGQSYTFARNEYTMQTPPNRPLIISSSGSESGDLLHTELNPVNNGTTYSDNYELSLPNGTKVSFGALPRLEGSHVALKTYVGLYRGYYVEANPSSPNFYTDSFHLFARVNEVVDCRGMKLDYVYNAGNSSLIPDEVKAYSAIGNLIASLSITHNGMRVESITSPEGNKVSYVYDNATLETFYESQDTSGVPSLLKEVKRALDVSETNFATTSYGYLYDERTITRYYYDEVEGDVVGSYNTPCPKLCIKSVEDANGNEYSFDYERKPRTWLSGYENRVDIKTEPLKITTIRHSGMPDTVSLYSTTMTAGRDIYINSSDRDDLDKYVYLWKTSLNETARWRISANYKITVNDAAGTTWYYDFKGGLDNDHMLQRLTYTHGVHNWIDWLDPQNRDTTLCAARKLVISNSAGYQEEIHFTLRDVVKFKISNLMHKFIGTVVIDKQVDEYDNETSFTYDPIQLYGHQAANTFTVLGQAGTRSETPLLSFSDKPSKKTNALNLYETYTYHPARSFPPKTQRDWASNSNGRLTTYEWYGINSNGYITDEAKTGLKKSENIAGAKTTTYYYNDTAFPSFMTELVEGAASGDPSFVSRTVKYESHAQGLVEKEIVDPTGLAITTRYGYDSNNNKIMEVDPNSNTNWFAYDTLNRLVAVTNANLTVRSFGYDLRGNKTSETNENEIVTFWQYDAFNRVTNEVVDLNENGIIDAADISAKTTYNAMGKVSSVTDPNGIVTTNRYDHLQRLTNSIVDPDGLAYFTSYEYGTNSGSLIFEPYGYKPTRIIDDTRGYEIIITYDELYREVERLKQINTTEYAKITKQYDDVGNLRYETRWKSTSVSQTTETRYDSFYNPYYVKFPDGKSHDFKYTSSGLLYWQQDEYDRRTTTDYDKAQRPWKVTQPTVAAGTPVTETGYDDAGNVTSTKDPEGNITTFWYDNRNRQTHTIQPSVWDEESGSYQNPTNIIYYDGVGNVTGMLDARQNLTTNFYDTANRLTNSTLPAVYVYGKGMEQPETSTVYDKNGNPRFVTDANEITIEMQYDTLNRLTKTIDGEEHEIAYDYDAGGNRTYIKDQNGNETTFEYDGLNNNDKIVYADWTVESYGYDWLGNKTSRTDANGLTTSYAHDSRNRLDLVTYLGTGRTRDYGYDWIGNLLTVTESDNTLANVSYTYDVLNRVETETSCGVTNTNGYDKAGNRTDADYGVTGRHIDWDYDALNRIETITDTKGYAKTTSVSGGGANLSNAIANAISGELLLVENGTYDPVVINKPVTVQSVNGAAYATIQATSGRCAKLSDNARLTGFTLTGGILVDEKGAGAFVGKGCLIADCDITSNAASNINAYGGGLFLQTGATAQNCLIRNNSALNGGGIFCEKGGIIRNCTSENNKADSMGGGGVFMQEGGWMANSIVDGNIATNTFARGGGGVLFYNDGGKVNSSTLSANTSTNNGAAYSHRSTYVDPGKIGEIRNSVFWNNQPSGISNGWAEEGNQTIDPSGITSASGANLAVSSYVSSETHVTGFKYDLNSNLMKRELPNDVDEYRTYDAVNRLAANTNKYQATEFATVDYQYDAVGNLRQMNDTVSGLHSIPSYATWNWTYDNAYRLKSESIQAGTEPIRKTEFDWDDAGNRTAMRKLSGGSLTSTTPYRPASKLNQMLGWTCGGTNALYTCDDNGNRVGKFITVNGENTPTTYGYDEDNRLIQVTLRDTEQPKVYAFAYDYRTRRITRETPTEKTTHVFDGGLSVQEFDVSDSSTLSVNNLTTESIRGEGMGGGVGGMVYSIRNGQIEASHSNHRGDVFARTDNMGNVNWFARYYAYGTRFNEVGATYDRQRGNTKDEETPLELSNEGARWQDIVHGVWLTPDPIGFGDGPNLYLYVHCNPITGFDPLGLYKKSDYEAAKQKEKKRYNAQIADLKKQRDSGNLSNKDYQKQYKKAGQTHWYRNFKYQQKSDEITQTAASMSDALGSNIDPDTLDDSWETYKKYRSSDLYMQFTGTRNFAKNATSGNYWKAAGDLALLEGEALLAYMIGAKFSKWSKVPDVTTINPHSVRFSQNSIKGTFKNGISIDDLVNGLKNGTIDPKDIPPIRLTERNGQLFSLDNRRLEAFKRAGVDAPYRLATPQESVKGAAKFSTSNGGTSIKIRGKK